MIPVGIGMSMTYTEIARHCGNCPNRDTSKKPKYPALPCKLAGIVKGKNRCLRKQYGVK